MLAASGETGMNEDRELRLDRLHERHPGLTRALGESYTEAACVCWSRHRTPPVTVSLKRAGTDDPRVVDFAVPDARMRAAHANEIDATESGAYGVSLAAVEDVEGFVAVGRAETLTGADWYIAPIGTSIEDLESRSPVCRLTPLTQGNGTKYLS